MVPRRPSHETLSVLSLMLQRPSADHYGLALAEEAELANGTVYPILRRLETKGWVTSRWEDVDPSEVGRPRKRLYRITGHGASETRRYLEGSRRLAADVGLPPLLARWSTSATGAR